MTEFLFSIKLGGFYFLYVIGISVITFHNNDVMSSTKLKRICCVSSHLYCILLSFFFLRYDAGKILLKDNFDVVPSEKLRLDRKSGADFYDVTIKSEDNCAIKAHKCVLVARLDYFHSMFLGGWSEVRPFDLLL